MNISAMIGDTGRRFPDRAAVSSASLTLTYAELCERSSHIAWSLRQAGLQPGARVVMAMENCGEFFEIMIGCWTAGLCVVPVNAKLHPRETAHIVADCAAQFIFATPRQAGELAAFAAPPCPMVVIGSPDYDVLLSGGILAPIEMDPSARAWLFYTSGTTGRPKGAILSHRNLLFMSQCYFADIDFVDERDVNLHMAPLSHASGLYAVPHLLRGGLQVVAPGFDLDTLAATLAAHDNVSFFAAPTMLTRIVRDPRAVELRNAGLKTIIYGGGPMYVADLTRALELFGPRLYQSYGQGETPMTITGLDKRGHVGPGAEARLATCGTARTGVAVSIRDADGAVLPAGEIGEIVTRSDCVMEGYWNNPDATAKAVRNGWLYTGDIGVVDASGFLQLRDRSKDLIVSGGTNIYPREVEEVLLRHPAVLEVSVVGRPDPEWGEDVLAFVVSRSGGAIDSDELDTLCLDHIARFKRPKHYRFIASLPKNSYGKVLKTELRALITQEIV